MLMTLSVVVWLSSSAALPGASSNTRQQSLDQWRSLTAATAPPPLVVTKGDEVRFYFRDTNGVESAFKAHWSRVRIPTTGYKVKSAVLRLDPALRPLREPEDGWRQATVLAGEEWRQLATNLISSLAPATPDRGVYYQAFLADGLLYRDCRGAAHFVPWGQQPQDLVLERRFSMEETLEVVSRLVDEQLARLHPGKSLFLIMAPNASRFTQPLLLDRKQRRCVFLAPAALYDFTERGGTLSATAEGFSALVPESHGIALFKNPVSSAARLADLAIASCVRFVRFPLPKPGLPSCPVGNRPGMDLEAWERWLDRYTGTRLEQGQLQLCIDDKFFDRFEQGLAVATNHIYLDVYIFDRDDVAVGIADQLKRRSNEIDVRVLLDRMASIVAGRNPPASPLPLDFVAPASIRSYLREGSRVKVRAFLNPWFSSDHAKVFLVDGRCAWLGGMNFGREYRYEWHDLMIELRGPIVASLETDFRRAWAHAGPLGDLGYAASLFRPAIKPEGNTAAGNWIKVRRLPTRTGWKPFSAAVLGSLRRAQSYIYAENPYLFDKRVILELVRARNRGVDVRVVLPRVNDFKAAGRGNLVVANYLLQHGVRVFFYPTMTHVKALLVDDWACLGSGNLNHLSLRVNKEQNVATSDPAFVARVRKELFQEDFARSHELKEPIAVDWVDFLADLALEGF